MTQPKGSPPEKPLGQWLVENMPRGTNLEIPDRQVEYHRELPFADWDDDDWGDE